MSRFSTQIKHSNVRSIGHSLFGASCHPQEKFDLLVQSTLSLLRRNTEKMSLLSSLKELSIADIVCHMSDSIPEFLRQALISKRYFLNTGDAYGSCETKLYGPVQNTL